LRGTVVERESFDFLSSQNVPKPLSRSAPSSSDIALASRPLQIIEELQGAFFRASQLPTHFKMSASLAPECNEVKE